jgi:hypothetical protein
MSVETKRIWTGSVTVGTLTIDETYGFSIVSVVLQSGTGTIEGNLISSNGVVSTPIALTVGQAITINTGSSQALQDYIKIVTTGTVLIIAR